MKKYIILSFALVFSVQLMAEVVSIPMNYTGNPAKDLVNAQGASLSTLKAKLLWAKKEDLSELSPSENDIWRNVDLVKSPIKLSKNLDNLGVSDELAYNYVDKVISVIGSFRFIVRENGENGKNRNFNIWMSKDSRSILLRKNLLRKLGYIIPKIQHQQKLKVKFKGLASLNAFIAELELGTFADSKRWIVEKNEDSYVLVLQDVLILESNNKIYNLGMGEINQDTVKHRRVINSLAIPFAMVDIRESVDGLSWNLGTIANKVMILDVISGEYFTTTYNDAKWIIKRMSRLKREDFEEVVKFSYFPDSVSKLMSEKLISRFNSIKSTFFPESEIIKINPEVSDNNGELKDGRLTQDNWKGHASRYSFDDTESPLSKDEMIAYFKSKFYSGVIENLVTYVNDKFLYDTDIQKAAIEKAVDAQRKQILNLFETGEFKRIPYSAWAIPTAKGHIAASRDIVTGSYLGTDNTIQIADSLEFIGEVGAFIGTLGLPVEAQVFGTAGVRFSRAYTHVKSIKSIKKALKEPYRNIIVPRVRAKKAKSIIEMIDSLKSEEFGKLEGEERTAEVEKIFKELNKVLEIGDSLIVSNNLILSGALIGGYRAPVNGIDLEALIQLNARKVNIWRLHITRTNDKTIQVYKSRANSFGKGFGVRAKLLIPIISINLDSQKGNVETNFHSLSFKNNDETPVLVRKLTELRQVLVENSTELMTKTQAPFTVKHQFEEDTATANSFSEQKMSVKLTDKLKVIHPEKYETDFYIRSLGKLTGKNYMQVGYDLLNGIIEEALDDDNISLNNTSSGNPGDSFKGQSFSRVTMTEVPFNHESAEIPFEDYVEIKSQWKGWSAGRSKLVSIKNIIDKKYGLNEKDQKVFSDEMFYDTDEIKLYTVDIVLSIYQYGIDHLINYDQDKFKTLIDKELVMPWPNGKSHYIKRAGRKFNKYRRDKSVLLKKVKRAHRELNSEHKTLLNPKFKSLNLTLLVNTIEAMLPFDIFEKLIGGDENYYLKGSINGFRVGRENGEEAITSNTIGELGSEHQGGIAATLRQAIKISQGELGAFWFLRRIQ
jgi:hypothetical protein